MQTYILKNQVAEGLVVTASEQTAGKGQQGNVWSSESGNNLLMSVLLNPVFMQVRSLFYLNKAIALAVRETVSRYTDKQVWIKWPNDILIAENKIAGILIESSIQGSRIKNCIVGAGLNVNQLHFPNLPNATSLSIVENREFALQDIFEELCMQIEKYYFKLRENKLEEVDVLYHTWLFRMNTLSKFKKENTFFEGIITGVNTDGKLIVSVNEIEQIFSVKEIALI